METKVTDRATHSAFPPYGEKTSCSLKLEMGEIFWMNYLFTKNAILINLKLFVTLMWIHQIISVKHFSFGPKHHSQNRKRWGRGVAMASLRTFITAARACTWNVGDQGSIPPFACHGKEFCSCVSNIAEEHPSHWVMEYSGVGDLNLMLNLFHCV